MPPRLPPRTPSPRAAEGARVAGGVDAGRRRPGQVDRDRVEALRQAIRDGRYRIDAHTIADRLIDEAAALLGLPLPH